MKLAYIIFDFDGVIADTNDVNFALAKALHPEITREDFIAHHDGNVYEEPRIPFTDATSVAYRAQYHAALSESHIARAHEPVVQLAERYALYVVSSSSEDAIRAVLEPSGLASKFARIMGYETHTSKIEKFSMLMREHGVTTDNAVFITDTLGDIREASKVGLTTIAETFGFHDRERLLIGQPHAIADSWDEVLHEIALLEGE